MAQVRFGLAIENFTASPDEPDFERIRAYGLRAEALGFDSLWAWDHMLLGSQTPFPFLDSLSTLAGLSAVTERVELGTGVLVLPLRNPVVLAKVTSSIDRMSGRPAGARRGLGLVRRASSRPSACRSTTAAPIFERNLDVLTRFWVDEQVPAKRTAWSSSAP